MIFECQTEIVCTPSTSPRNNTDGTILFSYQNN